MKITQLLYSAICVAIITICSWIAIPFGSIPFTMQTMAVGLTILLLGTKGALLSVAVYLLLGVVGLPVFAQFQGGVGVFATLPGGYLFGFVAMTLFCGPLTHLIYGKITRSAFSRSLLLMASLEAGTLVCYLVGTLYAAWILHMSGNGMGIGAILMMAVVPYLIPDIIKNVIAVIIAERIRKTGILNKLT